MTPQTQLPQKKKYIYIVSCVLLSSSHLHEESALYCPSGSEAPAGSTDSLVLHRGHSTCKTVCSISAEQHHIVCVDAI